MMNQPPPPPPMTTSSILGNPPPNLMINFPMQVSSSLLGTAPQMHSPGSFTPGRVVPSPAVATPPQPPPPPPPPPTGPPLLGNQPSILGNPPPFQYLPMMPQNMGPVPPNRPQNSAGYSGHQFDSAMPGPVHMPWVLEWRRQVTASQVVQLVSLSHPPLSRLSPLGTSLVQGVTSLLTRSFMPHPA